MVNSIMEKISQNSYDVQRKNLHKRLIQSAEFRCPGLNSRHSQTDLKKSHYKTWYKVFPQTPTPQVTIKTLKEIDDILY